jgi:hypothetical protein
VCRRIRAVKYFECSALTAEGVRETLYGIFSTTGKQPGDEKSGEGEVQKEGSKASEESGHEVVTWVGADIRGAGTLVV